MRAPLNGVLMVRAPLNGVFISCAHHYMVFLIMSRAIAKGLAEVQGAVAVRVDGLPVLAEKYVPFLVFWQTA